VQHGRILHVIEGVVREAAGDPPDTFQDATVPKLAAAYSLRRQQLLPLIRRQVGGEMDVDANQEFDESTIPSMVKSLSEDCGRPAPPWPAR
jgi:hypothetical protein